MGLRRGASTSTSSPGPRSTTPATATPRSSRRSRPGGRPGRDLEPLLLGAGDAPLRAARRIEPRAAARFCATRGPRPTRRRSSWRESTPAARHRAARGGRPRGRVSRTDARARWRRRRPLHGRTCSARCRRDSSASPAIRRAPWAQAVNESTAAILIEPIQGEAGVFEIADEVMTRRPRGLRLGRRGADLRRGADGDGAYRIAVGVRAARGDSPTCSPRRRRSAAAYPSAPASPPPQLGEVLGSRRSRVHLRRRRDRRRGRRSATLDVIDDPELLARVNDLGERLRDGLGDLRRDRRRPRSRPDGGGLPRPRPRRRRGGHSGRSPPGW